MLNGSKDALGVQLSRLGARAVFGVKPGLERVQAYLAARGDPQRRYRVVHVAGTNGKGSTAAMIEAILRHAGYRTGLYTSPHLCRFAERIHVCGTIIDDASLAGCLERALSDDQLSFFEVATVAAFEHFAASAVEVAVVETGLGGRLDATNVVTAELSIITTVDLDHQRILGADRLAIAKEKGAIIDNAQAAVCADSGAAVTRVLESCAGAVPLYVEGRDFYHSGVDAMHFRGRTWRLDDVRLPLCGDHQRQNAALALAGAECLAEAGFHIDARGCAAALPTVRWPGRLERMADVYLDCAHNPQACAALAATMRSLDGPYVLLFGALQDKAVDQMLGTLAAHASAIVLTTPPSPRATDASTLAGLLADTDRPLVVAADPQHALRCARQLGRPILVTGSAYLVGIVRALLLGLPRDAFALSDPGVAAMGGPERQAAKKAP